MTRNLSRLLKPESIALFGGNWVANVIEQLRKSGFAGEIWPVNPKREILGGVACFKSIGELPHAPDAAFVGVNREATIEIVRQLAAMGAGGATCFASGFLESETESAGGADLQNRLVAAAGDMPIVGPNCYGFLNYLDNVTLWPDQHGGGDIGKGVGIIAQSSNIAINMTMQKRVLPIAMMVAAGNQAQTGIADIATHMLEDDRITAIGLYLEGFGDIRALEAFAEDARDRGKPVIALKIGRSEKAQIATMTHTASLSGGGAASSALLKRLGFVETRSIATFLETLKLAHGFGGGMGNNIASVSCSGGEASLMADLAENTNISYREFSPKAKASLKEILGPIVTITNPLDYHTFIWGDTKRMRQVFETVMAEGFDLCVFVLDIPRADRCDPSSFQCAIDAIVAAKVKTGARVAVVSCLPENLSEDVSGHFLENGIVPLNGMEEGLAAITAFSKSSDKITGEPLLLSHSPVAATRMLDEATSKKALAVHGLEIPQSMRATSLPELEEAARKLNFPLCLKGLGIAHKSEEGAVALNLSSVEEVLEAARNIEDRASGFLLEEMVRGTVAELIVGITREPTGLFLLTFGAGGIMTELLQDTASTVLPVDETEIRAMLEGLKISALLSGFRGKPPANMDAVVAAIMAICNHAEENADLLIELDVNPLIVTSETAIAVDALIITREENHD